MTLEELIEEIETKHLKKDLESLTAKDRIQVYINVKEYQRAKLMRANFIPEEDEHEKDINIIIRPGGEGV